MRILITGGAGHVARIYRAHVGAAHQVRLLDRAPIVDVAPHQQALAGGLDDPALVRAACAGVDAVIHLAADRDPGADFLGSLLENNIVATYNVFAAAHAAGCPRMIFASSGHAISGLPDTRRDIDEAEICPGNLYGVSKCFGEDLARYYANAHGMRCICLRLGWVDPPIAQLRAGADADRTSYLSARDLCQMLDRALVADVPFAVLNVSSDNASNRFDLRRAHALLGYAPHDRVEDVLGGG
ncbi:MAG: NAD-dependent epimerase/dehydratase family protein [Roseiflexaceae bacterium]